jgi:hypothetical protein
MHGLVKKYVHPFFTFIAGIFCCTVTSSWSASQNQVWPD